MRELLNGAKILFEQDQLGDTLEIVNEIILNSNDNCDAFLLRGRIHYKMQKWGDSINDYYAVLELDPENQEAKSGIEMAKSILGYFTPDMFNP